MGGTMHTAVTAVACIMCLVIITVGGESADEASVREKRQAGGHNRCTNCVVNGQTFKGHSRFRYEENCKRYRCICRCSGEYECPARYTRNICSSSNSSNGAQNKVSSSSGASGQSSSSSSTMSKSEMVSSSSSSMHQSSSSSSSSQTASSSKDSRHRSQHGSQRGSRHGSRSRDRVRQTHGSQRGGRRRSRCVNCTVDGIIHPGHSYFDHTKDCVLYRHCICYCNGSFTCPANRARHIKDCKDGDVNKADTSAVGVSNAASSQSKTSQSSSSVISSSSSSSSAIDVSESGSSSINNSNNTVTKTEKTSQKNVERKQGRKKNKGHNRHKGTRRHRGCQNCTAKGQTFKGNAYFDLVDGCTKFSHCVCRCDGSWNCPPRFAKKLPDCGEENNQESTTTTTTPEKQPESCQMCEIMDKKFAPNKAFDIQDGCILYQECQCFCNGSWYCPPDKAKDVCAASDDPAFQVTTGCRSCNVGGETFPGNDYFGYRSGCLEYSACICYCNGSWVCPDSGVKHVCNSQEHASAIGGQCYDCEVYGKKYTADRPFNVQYGCIEYRDCFCSCNGSWACPRESAKNVCNQRNAGLQANGEVILEEDRCGSCEVYGKYFRGNSYFDILQGCTNYKNCICRCDGSWACKPRHAENVCKDANSDTQFSASVSGISGSSSNKSFKASRTESSSQVAASSLKTDSSANGNAVTAGSSMQKTLNTKEAKSVVNKAGSDTYSSQTVSETSSITETSNTTKTSSASSASSRKNDQSSSLSSSLAQGSSSSSESVVGKHAASKEESSSEIADISEKVGLVSDGWLGVHESVEAGGSLSTEISSDSEISKETVETVVVAAESTDTEETAVDTSLLLSEKNVTVLDVARFNDRCSFCTAKGKVVRGNNYFDLVDGCTEYKNCLCRCDGTWSCPKQFAINTCLHGNSTAAASGTTCGSCVAKGKVIKGNTKFNLLDKCTQYQDCECNCDGSWDCFKEKAIDICLGSDDRENACSMCKGKDGKLHFPNTQFKYLEDCIEYGCDCHCNGSWNCPAKNSKWICTDKCLDCQVRGETHTGNSTFTHLNGCLQFNCKCHCNGSWECPGDEVTTVCQDQDKCQKCSIDGETFPGESDFALERGCIHYDCRCNCDGSYNCPGEKARNTCRGEVLGGCRSCVISKDEIQKGETDFTIRRDCTIFQCRCNCDGSWECPAEDARNACLGEVPGGCRSCRVSENQVFIANSDFELKQGCIHYKCKCNCDGSWSCPGKDARDVCKGDVPGACRSCKFKENEYYRGNSNFEVVQECIHYKCKCNCDGSYECPAKDARRVCYGDSTTTLAPTPTTTQVACKTCRVSASEQFVDQSFSLERGCNRYQCICNCNGVWECPAERTTDICARTGENRRRCQACTIGKSVFPGDTSFLYRRRCTQYECSCACSSRWKCDYKNPVDICLEEERRQNELRRNTNDIDRAITSKATENRRNATSHRSNIARHESNRRGSRLSETSIRSDRRSRTRQSANARDVSSRMCRQCHVDGRTYQVEQQFSLDRGCLQYRKCVCNCNGRWQCEIERNVCDGDTDEEGNLRGVSASRREEINARRRQRSHSRGSSSSRQTSSVTNADDKTLTSEELQSRTWVAIDGVNRSHVTTGKRRTGGGYALKIDTEYKPTYDVRNRGNDDRLARLNAQEVASRSTVLSTSGLSKLDSASSSSSLSEDSSSSSLAASSSSKLDSGGISNCQKCQSDSKFYPAGANFDMRRGCVIYKCLCLCSGSYRCRLVSDNACSAERQNSCNNCVYGGMVFPGNMGFTVREGCTEKQCDCNCDGSYDCHSTKPLPGCSAASFPKVGAQQFGSFYPVGLSTDLVPASRGYLTNSGKAVYTTACEQFGGQGCQYAVHAPIQTVQRSSSESAQGHSSSRGSASGSVKSFSSATAEGKSYGYADPTGQGCGGCMVEKVLRKGNEAFTFEKDCIEFDCYCACGGAWKCSGRMSPSCARGSAPNKLPHAAGCRNCMVHGTEYPSESRFQLVQGCSEFQCTCSCDGSWDCPNQQPKNVCDQPSVSQPRRIFSEPLTLQEDLYQNDQTKVKINKQRTELVGTVRQSGNSATGCQTCSIDGMTVQPLAKFVRELGCYQSLCHCKCDGTAECSEGAAVNVCELPDKKPMSERPGCKVGRRVHFTRIFAHIEDCYERTCICHDNGDWKCSRSPDDRKVC